MNIVSSTEDLIRKKGIYVNVHLDLENQLAQLNIGNKEKVFKDDVISVVKTESLNAKPKERLLGSSEIIESLFGKQKHIEKQQSKSGFTGLLLSLAAIVSETTKNVVQEAMESVNTKTIIEWFKKNIGKSVQSKRISALSKKKPKIEEQKQTQKLMAA
jgi:hypothetical protein